MGRYGAPKRIQHMAGELPDDLMHIIFLKLDFKSKVIAEQVCKRWDQLLKAPLAGARHWDVNYNLDTTMSSQAFTTAEHISIMEGCSATFGRWLTNRAAAIKIVHVSASMSSGREGVVTRKVLKSQLPLLAGCLAKHDSPLDLEFCSRSPFARSPLSSSAFLRLLCPMVKKLALRSIMVHITAPQFAAICELSSLEELFIDADFDGQPGLQEMTSDISKLVNLTTLSLLNNFALKHIPESISCLQKLEEMNIHGSTLTEVPSGLATLASLSSLGITACGPLRFPPSLQGLKNLASVELNSCSLETVPEGLAGLTTLTYLDLSENKFRSSNGSSWWPTALSRLTMLVELILWKSRIVSLPPHISGLRQHTKLDIRDNKLRSLPEQLSSLYNLRVLWAQDNKLGSLPEQLSSLYNLRVLWAQENKLPTVPVSVLSSLTALTSIRLHTQWCEGIFHISSSLLPILHPGLVQLDLRQETDWDPVSLCHLGRALAEVAKRNPVPTLKFLFET